METTRREQSSIFGGGEFRMEGIMYSNYKNYSVEHMQPHVLFCSPTPPLPRVESCSEELFFNI